MDRINKLGRALIGYKSEYKKHYSPIVDESLMIALETQLEKKLLDQEIFDMIINDSYELSDFEKFIANRREYVKSQKELLEEFEKVRAIVNESLTKLNFVEFIETESNVEASKISILRQYTISEDFIKVYFGLEDEDMPQIMKKKGFAEKFAVLRLTKVFKEIFSEMRTEVEFTQGFSRVYYNPDVNGFSVDYKYHLPVDFITKENIDAKIKKIKDTDRVVERKFTKKTGINFYNIKTVEDNNNSLNISKNSPNNKFSEVEIDKKEIEKIQTQTKEEKVEDIKVETPKEEPKKEDKNKFVKEEPKVEKPIENKPKKEQPKEENKNNKNNKQNKNKEKQNNQNNQQKEQKAKPQIVVDDYLTTSLQEKDDVIEVMDEISNMQIEEDFSGEFDEGSFEGFLPDSDELDLPDDLDFPDDIDFDDIPDIDDDDI